MDNARDPYEVLGLFGGATSEDVKAAYRRLSMQHHPDRNPGDPHATFRFCEVNEAYEALRRVAKPAAAPCASCGGRGVVVRHFKTGLGPMDAEWPCPSCSLADF